MPTKDFTRNRETELSAADAARQAIARERAEGWTPGRDPLPERNVPLFLPDEATIAALGWQDLTVRIGRYHDLRRQAREAQEALAALDDRRAAVIREDREAYARAIQ